MDENSEIISHSCPYAYVEFPGLVQEGFLDILLNHPERLFLVLLEDEFRDVLQFAKHFNALALV